MLCFDSVSVELYDPLSALHHRALHDITFSLDAGEGVAVLGPNGAGKSTLLLAAAGVLPLCGGEITIEGRRIRGTSRTRRQVRELLGVALQFPERGFFATTVAEEVAFTCRRLGFPAKQSQEAVVEALERVGLPSGFLERSPYGLSGGEKRLVALAAAIAHRPKYLLLDEPEVGLDRRGCQRVSHIVRQFTREGGAALVVTHDLESSFSWTDRLLIINGGRVSTDLAIDELTLSERWDAIEAWLWDRGALGRACSRARRQGIAMPSPYVEPERWLESVRGRLEHRRH